MAFGVTNLGKLASLKIILLKFVGKFFPDFKKVCYEEACRKDMSQISANSENSWRNVPPSNSGVGRMWGLS